MPHSFSPASFESNCNDTATAMHSSPTALQRHRLVHARCRRCSRDLDLIPPYRRIRRDRAATGWSSYRRAAGPMTRVRICKDEQLWPDLSVGAYLSARHDSLDEATVFNAACKRFVTQPKGLIDQPTFTPVADGFGRIPPRMGSTVVGGPDWVFRR